MTIRYGELVATNESTVVTEESLSDSIMMEDGQSDGRLANSIGTDKTNGSEVFGKTDNLFNQLVTSKAGPRGWGRRFTRCAKTNVRYGFVGSSDC